MEIPCLIQTGSSRRGEIKILGRATGGTTLCLLYPYEHRQLFVAVVAGWVKLNIRNLQIQERPEESSTPKSGVTIAP
jgi:hypothetical protein